MAPRMAAQNSTSPGGIPAQIDGLLLHTMRVFPEHLGSGPCWAACVTRAGYHTVVDQSRHSSPWSFRRYFKTKIAGGNVYEKYARCSHVWSKTAIKGGRLSALLSAHTSKSNPRRRHAIHQAIDFFKIASINPRWRVTLYPPQQQLDVIHGD